MKEKVENFSAEKLNKRIKLFDKLSWLFIISPCVAVVPVVLEIAFSGATFGVLLDIVLTVGIVGMLMGAGAFVFGLRTQYETEQRIRRLANYSQTGETSNEQ